MKAQPLPMLVFCSVLAAGCEKLPAAPDVEEDPLPPATFSDTRDGQVWWPNPAAVPAGARGQFRAATGWLSIVDDQRVADGARVEVDYLRMYARVGGVDQLIARDEYEDGVVGGGLFERIPWYGNGSVPREHIRSRSTFQNGVLVVPVESCPDCVWHVWVEDFPRAILPEGTSRVWVETRFRIVGAAVLQLGFDYYRGQADTGCDIDLDGDQDPGMCEAGKSRWAFPTTTSDGWQVLSLGK